MPTESNNTQAQFAYLFCFVVLFFSFINFKLLLFGFSFLSRGLDFYLLTCKLQTCFNECLSQVWRDINGLC